MKERKDTTHHKKAGELMTREEELAEGVVDSMDASDPPSLARKGDDGNAVPSSGYKQEAGDGKDEGPETEKKATKEAGARCQRWARRREGKGGAGEGR